MTANAARSKVLQLHPSRRCNLQCQHCYSESGPNERDTLSLDVVLSAIADARAEGYDALSVSGGEPLLYKSLAEVLGFARSLGMRTAFTTNGMLLSARRLDELAAVVDLVAVSVDGRPSSHVEMRGHPRAFDAMAERLVLLREYGVTFGVLFTLTQYNVDELAWVANFALAEGASLLQIHPLHDDGAAVTNLPGAAPDGQELAFGVAEALRFGATHRNRIAVQVDAAWRSDLIESPAEVFAAGRPLAAEVLASLVDPLVIEPTGRVTPLVYGFASDYELGNLGSDSLAALAHRWRNNACDAFYDLCRRAWEHLKDPDAPALLNWYDELAHFASGRPLRWFGEHLAPA